MESNKNNKGNSSSRSSAHHDQGLANRSGEATSSQPENKEHHAPAGLDAPEPVVRVPADGLQWHALPDHVAENERENSSAGLEGRPNKGKKKAGKAYSKARKEHCAQRLRLLAGLQEKGQSDDSYPGGSESDDQWSEEDLDDEERSDWLGDIDLFDSELSYGDFSDDEKSEPFQGNGSSNP